MIKIKTIAKYRETPEFSSLGASRSDSDASIVEYVVAVQFSFRRKKDVLFNALQPGAASFIGVYNYLTGHADLRDLVTPLYASLVRDL